MTKCNISIADRRRTFWTTQPNARGFHQADCCSLVCAQPGLALVTSCDTDEQAKCCGDFPYQNVPCDERPVCDEPRTIATVGWVRSLALNMLLTDARLPNSASGYRPGGINGHWTESFMTNGRPIGSHVRYIAPGTSTRDLALLIKAYAHSTLDKLVAYEVASKVDVTTKYLKGNAFSMDAVIWTVNEAKASVGLTAVRTGNTFNWAT